MLVTNLMSSCVSSALNAWLASVLRSVLSQLLDTVMFVAALSRPCVGYRDLKIQSDPLITSSVVTTFRL